VTCASVHEIFVDASIIRIYSLYIYTHGQHKTFVKR